jgi:nucleotide-binding universal stress UspA family protein
MRPARPIARILFATDFSPASRRAFDEAVSLAASAHAKLTIVHILAPLLPAVPEQYLLSAEATDRLERRAREWSVRRLQKLAKHATRLGVEAALLIRGGEPASQILRAGASTRADVIVVGTHGRRGLSKFLMGSVAERVVRTSRRPVLTVRGG